MGGMKELLGNDLFSGFEARARPTDPVTSKAAAKFVDGALTHLMAAVLDAIRAAGSRGATWDEIAASTGIDKGSVSPRLKPLRERGLIRELTVDGETVKRAAAGKRCKQIAWVAT